MASDYRVLGESDLAALRSATRDFAYEVLVGLSESRKRLPSMLLYDDRGSEIYRQIAALEEYYPTACERQTLGRIGPQIAAELGGQPVEVIDLGAGDGAKTILLLEALSASSAEVRYVPIDISEGAMVQLAAAMREQMPDLEVSGLVSEYTDGLTWLGVQPTERCRLVLFLGSNIGNFDRPRARAFLRRLWTALRPDDQLLIGFDLKKDIDVLLDAYNDAAGVTSEFNLNLLARINGELGGKFELSKFRHFGTYDVFSGAMESYLVSLVRQEIWIEALSNGFAFEPWEPIHMEYSYKFLRTDIADLAAATGFAIEREVTDDRDYFVSSLWRVVKSSTD